MGISLFAGALDAAIRVAIGCPAAAVGCGRSQNMAMCIAVGRPAIAVGRGSALNVAP